MPSIFLVTFTFTILSLLSPCLAGEFGQTVYLVTAKPKPNRLPDLLTNLQERVYFDMRPFGRSLTYFLENTRLRGDGYAVWEEEDYCTPPLAQEREAALDEFFDDLEVRAVEKGEGWGLGPPLSDKCTEFDNKSIYLSY